jgi:hypothetical protein
MFINTLPFPTESRNPGNFPQYIYRLLIVQLEVNWKFVVCPFVDEEKNGSNPFVNGLNGLNGLAHLW